jgi:Zn-dependent peptidase ImmA (M78 family)
VKSVKKRGRLRVVPPKTRRSRSPAEYAIWCREISNCVSDERIDLNALAADRGVEVECAPVKGFEGVAMVKYGFAAIILQEDQPPRRQRFTLAHELGHVFLPRHWRALEDVGPFYDGDVVEANGRSDYEREANEFAAELLAPKRLIRPHLQRGALDVSKASVIAEQFDMSLTAAGLRVVQAVDQPVAMLLFQADRLKWWAKTDSFPYGIPGIGTGPPPGTVAADLRAGGAGTPDAVEADPLAWLPERTYGGYPPLQESAVRLGSMDQTLVILWSPT